MGKEARKPWWNTGAYQTLLANRCDVATPDTLSTCNFATAYSELLDVIRTVGPDANTPPEVHIMIPPPLMQDGAYNMNQTIINTIYPRLIPLIGAANSDIVSSVIDVYTGMGGVPAPDWETQMPDKCTLDSTCFHANGTAMSSPASQDSATPTML